MKHLNSRYLAKLNFIPKSEDCKVYYNSKFGSTKDDISETAFLKFAFIIIYESFLC